jgi:hypothetical protein
MGILIRFFFALSNAFRMAEEPLRLAVAIANHAVFIANDHEGAEAEVLSSLHDLR